MDHLYQNLQEQLNKNIEERERTAKPLTEESFKKLMVSEAESPNSNPQGELWFQVVGDHNSKGRE
jgi:hypothetical protein